MKAIKGTKGDLQLNFHSVRKAKDINSNGYFLAWVMEHWIYQTIQDKKMCRTLQVMLQVVYMK